MKNIYITLFLVALTSLSSLAQTFSPTDGATDVSKSPVLTATFGDVVTLGSGQTIYVFKTSNPAENIALSTGVTFPPAAPDSRLTISGNELTIDLSGDLLTPGTEYAVYAASNTIFVGGVSYDGFNDFGNPSWAFTTDATPTLDPANGATDISQSPNLSALFSGAVTLTNNQSIIVFQTDDFGNSITLNTGNPPFVSRDSRLSIVDNNLTIDLSSDLLLGGKTFAVYAPSNVILIDGISFDDFNDFNNPTWAFTTVAAETPTLIPADGSTDISRTPTLSATFSNSVTFADNEFITLFKVSSPADNPINLATGEAPFYAGRDSRLSINGNEFTIDLSSDLLDGDTEYGVYAESGVIFVGGNPFNGFNNALNPGWAFTTATDLPSPTVLTYTPIDGATEVSIKQSFSLTFDQEIQANQSATSTYVRLYEQGIGTPVIECLIDNGVIEPGKGVSIASDVLTITPTSDLKENTIYYFTIDAGAVESLQGAPYAGIDNSVTTWAFTTETHPSILTYDPIQDAIEVDINKTIQITFDQNIVANASPDFRYIKIKDAEDDSDFLSIYVRNGAFESGKGASISNAILTIDPPSSFEPSKTYYLEIDYGVIFDTNGNAFEGIDNSPSNNYSFSTVTNPPGITIYTPIQDAIEVPTNQVLSLQFDKDIQFNQSVANNYVYIYDSNAPGSPIYQCIIQGGSSQFPSQVYISGTNTLVIDTPTDLELNTNYYVVIDAGAIEALSGDPFGGIDNSGSNNWRFTTITAPIWANNYPLLENQTETTVDLSGQTHKSGEYYYVITTSNVAPTEAQIEAGQDELGQTALISGNGIMTADIEFNATNIDISILTINIDHFVYVVAKETVYNQYSTIEQLLLIRNVLNTWTGDVSNVYNEPGNWSGSYVNQGSIYIPASSANFPLMNDVITVNNIEVEAGAELTIGNSGNITVLGSLDLYSSANQNASLLQNGTLNISSSNVRVHQAISANNRSYYMASPVVGATQNSIGADVGMFSWDNSTGNYVTVNPSASMVETTGYVLRSNNNLVFSGALNNGSQLATVYRSEKGLGWNLIGNPYPSAVEWDTPDIIKTDIVDAFWIYLNDQSIYGVYNSSIGEAVNIPNSRIPSQHAFWVKVLEGSYTTGDVRFTNASRIHNNTSYLKANQASSNPTLKLAGSNGSYRDETVIAFNDNATDDLDNFDCEKKFSSSGNYLQLYTSTTEEDLCINSLMSLTEDKVIPLSYRVSSAGDYSIEKVQLNNFESLGIDVLLEDVLTSTTIDLSLTSNYNFTTSVSGDVNDRFRLHFKGVATDIGEGTINNAISIYSFENSAYVKLNNLNNPTYKIFNTSGNLVDQGILTPSTVNRVAIGQKGIYIVQVTHDKGTEAQKIVIK